MRNICLLILILIAGGCSGLQRPTVQPQRVAVTQQTEQGARIEFVVGLDNPNDKPLPVEEIQYRVELPDTGESFSFTSRDPVTIPANGSQAVVLPAAFETGGQGVTGRPYRISGKIVYWTPGEMRRLMTESGVPLPSAKFATSGTLLSHNQ